MANTVDKVINIALNEVGYLEKKSNAQLYDKTANAGSNNYTKYNKEMHDIYPSVMNFPAAWCDAFVDWCFYQAYGVANAKALIGGNFDDYTPNSANLYKKKNAWYTSDPQIGDQIFFKNTQRICHTGLVYDVDDTYVYTVEGNTSSAAGMVANGGCVRKKKYRLSYSSIAGYGRPKYDMPNQTSVSNQQKPVTPAPSRNYLMRGDKGGDVKAMQENLIKLGYSCGKYGADGDFGGDTDKAVRSFQKTNGLVVDGKYGEKSKAKVNELLTKLATQSATINKIDTVKEVQNWANSNYRSGLVVDGIYGSATKKALVKILQTEINKMYNAKLVVDGIWGAKTRAACPALRMGAENNIVKVLQALLVCNGFQAAYVDGEYGSGTYNSVKSYQQKKMLSVDGIAGKNTFTKLCE